MPWWMWVAGGVLLLAVEVVVPGGLFALFFGVSGMLVGLLAGVGLVEELWLQTTIFSVLAVVTLVLFRARLVRWIGTGKQKSPPMADIQGEVATLLDDLEVGATGKAELRGVRWNAQNADTTKLVSGQRCKVVAVEGLKLFIVSE